ncbi:MAG: glycosylase [Ruminococcaceae bacterium]|nr:glycosylase [Oscillospiraceae bacterium]
MLIPFNYATPLADRFVTPERMREVRAMLDTPVKRGSVIEFPDRFADCPSVFRWKDRWIMTFIAISKDTSVSGYETHFAESDDLLHWRYRAPLLRRDESRVWDSKQIAGYAALYDPGIDRGSRLTAHAGRYWMTYLAGSSDGYEPDPLLMGIASAEDPTDPDSFIRCERPILTPQDADARFFETRTLYKSTVVRDENGITGYPFVMFYNAKGYDGRERIYTAVTDDPELKRWIRCGSRPVIDDATGDPDCIITGDPMLLCDRDGLWIMNFMKCTHSGGAFDTFACSYDLIHWTEWMGPPTAAPSPDDPNENLYAHKPWIVSWEGHIYHFYCACTRDNRRYIALATDF